ncbi:TPA: hypothetical protein DDW35_03140 [Candidatus Sumerlaeota bacterium]|nr:hypothetical protein [Candidatus Sumerlaeota bacterium]
MKVGELLTRESVRKAREGVQKEYNTLGYMKTKVETDVVPQGDGKAVLQVRVEEGGKVRVVKLAFEGNNYFSSARLRFAVETKSSWLFFKNYYDEGAFDRDLDAIRQLYLAHGFFDVQVARGAFKFDETDKEISPKVRIVEGARYKLGRVEVQGASTFKPEELQASFRDLVGKNFSRKEYNEALEKARRLYADAGYITTEVADDLDFDRSKGEVRSTLTVQEGPKIHVGKLLLERPHMIDPGKPSWFGKIYGYVAPPVQDKVIAREAKLKSGSVYEKRKEEMAEERLRRLDVFETAKIESQATNDPNVRDARISVEEGVTGNLMVGVGMSDALGAFVWTSFSEKNIGGRADVITVGGELGQKASSGRASYLDRHVGESDVSLQYQAYYTDTDEPGYHERIAGASVEAGIPMESLSSSDAFGEGMWKMYLRARAEHVRTDEGDYNPEEDFNRNYAVATGRVRVERNGVTTEKLDGKNYDKTGGFLVGVGLEEGVADGTLTKVTTDLDVYQKVTKKLVFASEMQAGIMPNDAKDIGPTERYYLGGTDDLRGFKYRQAGPHDKGDSDVPLGGATKLLARNELRYPLFESITGVMFLDAGTLDDKAFSIGDPRASTGVGLRIKIKRMEMGVDLAVPVLTQDHDQKRFFHFNIKGGVTP